MEAVPVEVSVELEEPVVLEEVEVEPAVVAPWVEPAVSGAHAEITTVLTRHASDREQATDLASVIEESFLALYSDPLKQPSATTVSRVQTFF